MPTEAAPPAPLIAASSLTAPSWRMLVLIGFCAVCGTAAEIFMKLGADESAAAAETAGLLGRIGLTSGWVWASIAVTLCGFGGWWRVVSSAPLSVAFPLANVVHVLIPLSSWIFLGEQIGPRRWLGIALVVAGLVTIARPQAEMEGRRQ